MGSEHSDGATQVARPRHTKACRWQAVQRVLVGCIRGNSKERPCGEGGGGAHAGTGSHRYAEALVIVRGPRHRYPCWTRLLRRTLCASLAPGDATSRGAGDARWHCPVHGLLVLPVPRYPPKVGDVAEDGWTLARCA